MNVLDLKGEWLLKKDGDSGIKGYLPGCNYLDYMANGMEDPFWKENEIKANEVARHDYIYSRDFKVSKEMLEEKYLELVADGIDTLCTISINDKEIADTSNINRTYRIDIKDVVNEGINSISLYLKNPYPVIDKMNEENPLPMSSMPIKGVGQIRKTPCHFGWDWGPKLPPVGVMRSITVESYTIKIDDIKIRQIHMDDKVKLVIEVKVNEAVDRLRSCVKLISPDNSEHLYSAKSNDKTFEYEIEIEDPRLWWSNGLGDQPLYKLEISVSDDDILVDKVHRQIGLRTIELDTSPDKYGNQFRFIVNGVPIFAKGADWIPADSFITRFSREDMFFYIKQTKKANMNMLRVWGGGYYESEDFYDACDKYGILVWQDFNFACNGYPLDKKDYLENVHYEVIDNVKRLRHRASLALWCGNNENEIALILKKYEKQPPVLKNNLMFYHNTLKNWVNELDGITKYWPGSPSGGDLFEKKVHSMKDGEIWGDTHLWNVWHGMEPIEAFRTFPTRFCSEYGMESMPSMNTIKTFTDNPKPELFDSVMLLHQKSGGGNEKILYYLLAKYRNPAKFEDFVYLSQLVQANTVGFATDCWRRNIGKQNGALFWQLNDCWPVASWAAIDYGKQFKAVMYMSKHFNKMLCISNDYFKDKAELYITNEYPNNFCGKLEWILKDFKGNLINKGEKEVIVDKVSSLKVVTLNHNDILKKHKKTDVYLEVRLVDNESKIVDEKYYLLVPDKKASLPKVNIKKDISVKDGVATITLTSDTYARYVYLEAEDVLNPYSDNFFDICPNKSVTITVELPEDMSEEEFQDRLKVKSLSDVEAANSVLVDKWLRFKMIFKKKNYLTWIIYKIYLR